MVDDKRAVGRLGLGGGPLLLGAGVGVVALLTSAAIALAVVTGDDTGPAGKRASGTSAAQTPVGDLLAGSDLPRPSLAGDTSSVGVPANTSPRPTAPVTGPSAAPDTGRITGYRGASGTLTPVGIATLAIKTGCPVDSAAIATAIAMAESGGSPAAQGDTTLMEMTWDWSAGLWQIRGLRAQRDTGQLRDSVANQDPLTNASSMYAISNGCSNWTAWTTYTRGSYRAFLSLAERAARFVQTYREAHGGQLPPVAPRDPRAPVPAGATARSTVDARATGSSRPTSGATRRSGVPETPATDSYAAPAGGGDTPVTSRTTVGGTSRTRQAPAPTRTRSSPAPTERDTSAPSSSTLPTLVPTTLPRLPTLLPTRLSVPTGFG